MQICKRSGTIPKARSSAIPTIPRPPKIGGLIIAPDGVARTVEFNPPRPPRFGPGIRWLRTRALRCRQEVIANVAGVSPSTVSRWESEDIEPSFDAIRRLEMFCTQNHIDLGHDWLANPPRET